MMRNFGIWLLALLGVSLVSCNSNESSGEYALKASDSILRIQLDSLTSNISEWLDYYFDEESNSGLLFSVDPTANELELYSIEEGVLVQKVAYNTEGPNGVGTLMAGAILGLDSLLIFQPFSNSIFQSNLNDSRLGKIKYKKPDEYSSILSETKYFRSIPFLKDNYLYTKTFFGGNYLMLGNEELSTKPLMYRVDLASGEIEFSAFTFPDDYWAEGKRHYEFSSALDNNRFVFSFYGDHNVYYGESFQDPLDKKPAKSKYLSQEFEDLPETANPNDRRIYFATAAHYGSLIYDQFRDVYYRFCYPKKEFESDQDFREMTLFPEEFSVMVLNSELEVIGETLFGNDGQKYASNNVFVGPKGLYISVNHPKNELNKEDSFSFKLFKLELIKD
ncbi:MAG: DUF4221 family protein [Oceanospirillaceae bacterium]|nr:DUF4221 family protein [Oceanospirillaceae bacterium]